MVSTYMVPQTRGTNRICTTRNSGFQLMAGRWPHTTIADQPRTIWNVSIGCGIIWLLAAFFGIDILSLLVGRLSLPIHSATRAPAQAHETALHLHITPSLPVQPL